MDWDWLFVQKGAEFAVAVVGTLPVTVQARSVATRLAPKRFRRRATLLLRWSYAIVMAVLAGVLFYSGDRVEKQNAAVANQREHTIRALEQSALANARYTEVRRREAQSYRDEAEVYRLKSRGNVKRANEEGVQPCR